MFQDEIVEEIHRIREEYSRLLSHSGRVKTLAFRRRLQQARQTW